MKLNPNQAKEVFKSVFNHGGGDFVLEKLRSFCKVDTDGFEGGSDRMAYNAGRRSVYLYIESMIKEKKHDQEGENNA